MAHHRPTIVDKRNIRFALMLYSSSYAQLE